MDWRVFFSDLNMVWTTLGLATAGLATAFMVGRWWGRRSVSPLREIAYERDEELAAKNREIAELNRRLRETVPDPGPQALQQDEGLPPPSVQVWLKPVNPQDAALASMQGRLPCLLIANLKGGVGKTMVAANIAAYFSNRSDYPLTQGLTNKRVLLIDLDYQGSLSGLVLTAMRAVPEHPNSQVKTLFDPTISDEDAANYRVRPTGQRPNLSLYPATYGFDDLETREQFRWLAGSTDDDVRFRLLKRLRSPAFLNLFDLVIIDTGPRLTTGSVGALAAATHMIIPTAPNRRDVEAAERFMRRVSVLKHGGVCSGINVIGAVATLTRGGVRGVESANAAKQMLQTAVDNDPDLQRLVAPRFVKQVFLGSQMPLSQPIVDQSDGGLPYLATTASRTIFGDIGAEIEQRMSNADP